MSIDRSRLVTAAQKSAEIEAKARQQRVGELRRMLAETDYVATSDYDRKEEKADVFRLRQEWRAELRQIEGGRE